MLIISEWINPSLITAYLSSIRGQTGMDTKGKGVKSLLYDRRQMIMTWWWSHNR